MPSDPPLLAIVPKRDVDAAIEHFKADGSYDADRRIREADPDTVAIPVSREPSAYALSVTPDRRPDWRVRDLDDLLRARGVPRHVREQAPGSWSVIGSIVLGRFDDCPQEATIGEALLELHGAETVLSLEGITGEHREPSVRVIAGSGATHTIHIEDGTIYELDLAAVMFSPGNHAERRRMGELVGSEEVVFDMFAGIGYFTLPMARAGAHVIATERNPAAYRYLCANIEHNGVEHAVDAYRADCRAIRPHADRVVMGHYDAYQYLPAAVEGLRDGGVLHVHALTPVDDPWSEPIEHITRAVGERSVQVLDRHPVKTHSPGLQHVVVDALLGDRSD